MSSVNFKVPESRDSNQDLATYVDGIADILAVTQKLLQWAINGNLDVHNIRANSVNADRIVAETITALQIMANTITADKMSVTELSAITANLGTITAGIIYGAYIATANGTYPRVELSSTGNLLKAYYDVATYIAINPGLGGLLDPLIQFIDTTINSSIGNSHVFGDAFIITSDADVIVSSNAGNNASLLSGSGNVSLIASSGNVIAQSSAGTITDIVASINSLNSSITSLNSSITSLNSSISSLTSSKANHGSTSSTAVADGHNHGIPNGTVLSTPTGTVTFVSYGGSAAHSHTV